MLGGVKFCLAPERQQDALPAGFLALWWMKVFLSQMHIWHLDGLCLGINWWKISESLSKCIPQSCKISQEDCFECTIQNEGFLGGVRGVKVELKDSCFKGQTGRIGSISSLSSAQASVCPVEDSAHKAAKVMLLYREKSLWIKHLERFYFTVFSLVRMQFQCPCWRSTGDFLNGKTEWDCALFQSENVVFWVEALLVRATETRLQAMGRLCRWKREADAFTLCPHKWFD